MHEDEDIILITDDGTVDSYAGRGHLGARQKHAGRASDARGRRAVKVVCVARTEADEEEPEEAETPAESEIPNLESDEEI